MRGVVTLLCTGTQSAARLYSPVELWAYEAYVHVSDHTFSTSHPLTRPLVGRQCRPAQRRVRGRRQEVRDRQQAAQAHNSRKQAGRRDGSLPQCVHSRMHAVMPHPCCSCQGARGGGQADHTGPDGQEPHAEGASHGMSTTAIMASQMPTFALPRTTDTLPCRRSTRSRR